MSPSFATIIIASAPLFLFSRRCCYYIISIRYIFFIRSPNHPLNTLGVGLTSTQQQIEKRIYLLLLFFYNLYIYRPRYKNKAIKDRRSHYYCIRTYNRRRA